MSVTNLSQTAAAQLPDQVDQSCARFHQAAVAWASADSTATDSDAVSTQLQELVRRHNQLKVACQHAQLPTDDLEDAQAATSKRTAILNELLTGLGAACADAQALLDVLPVGPPLSYADTSARQIISYAHRLRSTTFAPLGWDPVTRLPPAVPPAPQELDMLQSTCYKFGQQQAAKLKLKEQQSAFQQQEQQQQEQQQREQQQQAAAPARQAPSQPPVPAWASGIDLRSKLPPDWQPGDPLPDDLLPEDLEQLLNQMQSQEELGVRPSPQPQPSPTRPPPALGAFTFGALNPDLELADEYTTTDEEDSSDDDDGF